VTDNYTFRIQIQIL